MFTGIVQTTAAILEALPTPTGRRLTVERGQLRAQVQHGDSICVSGVCLTAVDIRSDRLGFDVIHETFGKTTIGMLGVGDRVNLEPAVTPNQPMGGHFMQGHVDALAVVSAIDTEGGAWRVTFKPVDLSSHGLPIPLKRAGQGMTGDAYASDLMDFIIPRGSVAIEGVSLTLARVREDSFDVALIPATLELTTLGTLKVGDKVNIEADILAKTLVQQLRRIKSGSDPREEKVTMQLLREAGFIE